MIKLKSGILYNPKIHGQTKTFRFQTFANFDTIIVYSMF